MGLADLLLTSRTIDRAVLEKALAHVGQVQRPLANVLVAYGVVDPRRIARLLSRSLGLDITDVAVVTVHPKVLELVPRHAAEQFRVLPIGVKPFEGGNRLYLAMSDPTDRHTIDTVAAAVGLPVEPMLCDDAVLQRAFDIHYRHAPTPPPPPAEPPPPGPAFLTEATPEALHALEVARAHGAAGGGRAGDPRRGAVAAALGMEPTGSQPLPPTWEAPAPPSSSWEPPAPPPAAAPPPATPAFMRGVTLDATALPPDAGLDDPFAGESLPPDRAAWAASQEGPSMPPDAAWGGSMEGMPVMMPAPTTPPLTPPPPPPAATSSPGAMASMVASPTSVASVSSVPRVIVATTIAAAAIRELLWERIGPVEVVGDDVDACRLAGGQPGLVLIEPQHRNDLLRALLELEDAEQRPRIIVVGGDPSLRLMGCIDLQVEMPERRGHLPDVIHQALRQVGCVP